MAAAYAGASTLHHGAKKKRKHHDATQAQTAGRRHGA